MADVTVGGKYRLEEEIANGGCGSVFLGVHTIAGKEVAIKLEPALPHPHTLSSPLRQESKVYKSLMGGPGVPWIMYSGKQGDYNVMVIDLLGPSLEDLFKMCNRCFSLGTVLLLADQLISRLAFIHSRSYIHRDVKPANFVIGQPSSPSASVVSIIDFGLARRFKDARTGEHLPWRRDAYGGNRHGVGTSLFASLGAHWGEETSRRDDLESLAYMLIYFARGTLPWRKIKGRTIGETWESIGEAKLKEVAELLGVCGRHPYAEATTRSSLWSDERSSEEPVLGDESDSTSEHEQMPTTPEKSRPLPTYIHSPTRKTPQESRRQSRDRGTYQSYTPARTLSTSANYVSDLPQMDDENAPSNEWEQEEDETENLQAEIMLPAIPLTDSLPPEFTSLLAYALSLRFTDLPDYEGLRSMFRDLGRRNGVHYADEVERDDSGNIVDGSAHPTEFDWIRKGRKGTVRTGRVRVCEACKAAALGGNRKMQWR